VQTFFITRKSSGGHAKTSVTLPLLKIIKLHTASELKKKYQINAENLVSLGGYASNSVIVDDTVTTSAVMPR